MIKDWLEIDGLNIEFNCEYGHKEEAVGIMSDYHIIDILHVWLDNDILIELDILPILSRDQFIKIEEEVENYLNKIKPI